MNGLSGTMIQSPRRRFAWPVAAAAGLFLVLLLLPGTGRIVRTELAVPDFGPRTFEWVMHDLGVDSRHGDAGVAQRPFRKEYAAIDRVAQQHPDDLQLQLGRVTDVAGLETVVPRFPNSPALYASILRLSTLRDVQLRRREEDTLSPPDSGLGQSPLPPPSPAIFARYDAAAVAGERCDPENGFFPMMRAVGLLTEHRDTDALSEIRRAGQDPRWDDYSNEMAAGRWRLVRAASVNNSALIRSAIYAGVLLPHFAQFRAVARFAIADAVRDEQGEHLEDGLHLRHAIMQCGDHMAAQSHSVIGSLVGFAIAAIATARPGGVMPSDLSKVPAAQRTQLRFQQYYAYLRRIGHPAEADWAQTVLARQAQARDIIKRAMDLTPFSAAFQGALLFWWIAGLALLANILWMVVLGGVGVLLEQRGVNRLTWLLLGALGIGLTAAMIAWEIQWIDALTSVAITTLELMNPEGAMAGVPIALVRAASLTLMLAVPCLVFFGLVVWSLVRRISLRIGLAHTLRKAAGVTGLILVILYALCVAGTVRQEASLNGALDQIQQHEGRYMARLIHTTWPGDPGPSTEPEPSTDEPELGSTPAP